jgi:putative ABC transport system permease protein
VSHEAPLIAASCRAYGILLRVLPSRLRERHGTEASELFRDLYRDAYESGGLSGLVGYWLRAIVGLARWEGKPAIPHAPRRRSGGERLAAMILYDLKHAGRALRRNPGFTIVAVITLALGIGASSAIFAVVHAVVINPLPYPESERFVTLAHNAPAAGFTNAELDASPGLFFYYGNHSRTLDEIGAWRYREATLSSHGEPENVPAASATAGLFRLLGVPPLHGRPILEEDNREGAEDVVVLSHGLWRRRYGNDPDIVGSTIVLWGKPVQVVGVMPPGFGYPDQDCQLWFNETLSPDVFGAFWINVTARMRPGLTRDDVEAELTALIQQIPEAYPDDPVAQMALDIELAAVAIPLKERVIGDVQRTLWVLLATVGLVLLIACANVANLFLVRAEARRHEIAVRSALGAGRWRLARFFMAESILLSAAGAAIGLALAAVGTRLLVVYGPATLPRLDEVGISGTVVLFASALALLASFVFGVTPALRRQGATVSSLKDAGRSSTAARGRVRARSLLVAGQVAMAFLLLSSSLLMAQTYANLRRIDLGFDPTSLLTFQVALPAVDYPTSQEAIAFHRQLRERLGALPGVASAAIVTGLPLAGRTVMDPLVEKDVPFDPAQMPPIVNIDAAGDGYWKTMGIPLLEGRVLETADYDHGRRVAVVDERLADLYWPGESAIGRRVFPGLPDEEVEWFEVVGVVGTVRLDELIEAPKPMIYPVLGLYGGNEVWTMSYALRTRVPPSSLADLARETVWSLDDGLPIAAMQTMEQAHRRAAAPAAFTMTLLLIAAVVALCLGAVGIYGVIAYVVRQRTNEIGVRLALGARSADVSRMIVRQGSLVAAAGLVVGLAGSLALTRFMGALLVGIAPTDPATHMGVALALMAVAALASYLPARRAARINPVEALRAE